MALNPILHVILQLFRSHSTLSSASEVDLQIGTLAINFASELMQRCERDLVFENLYFYSGVDPLKHRGVSSHFLDFWVALIKCIVNCGI